MPDRVALAIVVAFAVSALASLSVAVPQAVLLVRLLRARDPIAPYTLKTVAWTTTIGAAFLWRCAVFVDFAFFDQRYMGTIDRRWGPEAALSFLLAAAVLYAAALYHKTVTLRR